MSSAPPSSRRRTRSGGTRDAAGQAQPLVTPGAYEVRPARPGKRQENPLCVLAAVADHIAPRRASYRTNQLVGGPVRFVLSTRGHVAGIVNPPGNPKSVHRVGEQLPGDATGWHAQARRHQVSWWEDQLVGGPAGVGQGTLRFP